MKEKLTIGTRRVHSKRRQLYSTNSGSSLTEGIIPATQFNWFSLYWTEFRRCSLFASPLLVLATCARPTRFVQLNNTPCVHCALTRSLQHCDNIHHYNGATAASAAAASSSSQQQRQQRADFFRNARSFLIPNVKLLLESPQNPSDAIFGETERGSRADGRTDGWMDGRMDERTDGKRVCRLESLQQEKKKQGSPAVVKVERGPRWQREAEWIRLLFTIESGASTIAMALGLLAGGPCPTDGRMSGREGGRAYEGQAGVVRLAGSRPAVLSLVGRDVRAGGRSVILVARPRAVIL